jgi:hypothetical protein
MCHPERSVCDVEQPPLHPAELMPVDARMFVRSFNVVARYESLSGTAVRAQCRTTCLMHWKSGSGCSTSRMLRR